MTDTDKLVEQLRLRGLGVSGIDSKSMLEAADALASLKAEKREADERFDKWHTIAAEQHARAEKAEAKLARAQEALKAVDSAFSAYFPEGPDGEPPANMIPVAHEYAAPWRLVRAALSSNGATRRATKREPSCSCDFENGQCHARPLNCKAVAQAFASWRTIESAPKDLSVVLLYQPAGAGNAECVGQGHRADLHEHSHDKWVFQATGWRAEPTHWQPLPAPPLSRDKSEGIA